MQRASLFFPLPSFYSLSSLFFPLPSFFTLPSFFPSLSPFLQSILLLGQSLPARAPSKEHPFSSLFPLSSLYLPSLFPLPPFFPLPFLPYLSSFIPIFFFDSIYPGAQSKAFFPLPYFSFFPSLSFFIPYLFSFLL